MAPDPRTQRYRRWYGRMLRLYPKQHQDRFAEGMAQTFQDVLQACAAQQRSLLPCVMWLFAETLNGIVRENMSSFIAQHRNIARIAAVTVLLLLVPLAAMQFTAEVQWSLFDFIAAGTLIFGAGVSFELLTRQARVFQYKAAAGLSVFGALALVWINLAVGIIGSEDNPANLLYFGVLAVGFTLALIAQFRPRGMAYALFATAAALALVPIIGVFSWRPGLSWELVKVLSLNWCFVLLFAGSAALFRVADSAMRGRGEGH